MIIQRTDTPQQLREQIRTFLKGKGSGSSDHILKPDKGSVSTGVRVFTSDTPNIEDQILEHLQDHTFEDWTLSEVIKPKLHTTSHTTTQSGEGYITSLRLYFLLTKLNDREVSAYLYDHFMVYRAEEPFEGDITDPRTFLTNYMHDKDIDSKLADEKFVKERFIPHAEWMAGFSPDAQKRMKNEINRALAVIADRVRDRLLAFNDQKMSQTRSKYAPDWLSYHVYGADVLVREDGSIKILELNGAPAMNVKTRYYGLEDTRLDYFDLFDDLMSKTVDRVFPQPCRQQAESCNSNGFQLVYRSDRQCLPITAPTYYIAYSITQKYPFMLAALEKRQYLRRTRTLYDSVDFFWGLRERYVVPESNMNYYDEIINYLTSKRMRNARIINKVQGITYYLASKDRMYTEIVDHCGQDVADTFLPVTFQLFYKKYYDAFHRVRKYIRSRKYRDIHAWIVKPVHGSRGLGISIFHRDEYDWSSTKIAHAITAHIQAGSNIGYRIKDATVQNKTAFNGLQYDDGVYYKSQNYRYWTICQYLDSPDLLIPPGLRESAPAPTALRGSRFIDGFGFDLWNLPSSRREHTGHKYNIRFYVLLTLNDLPTFKDIKQASTYKKKEKGCMDAYIFKDFMTYFTLLPYNTSSHNASAVPAEFRNLSPETLSRMRGLTNFEMIDNLYDENRKRGYTDEENIDRDQWKHDLTGLYSDLVDEHKFHTVWNQALNITKKTLDSVKYNLRALNRHSEAGYLGCFNLLAYDTLLDEFGKLWLVEINRGPDIVGLQKTLGDEACTEIFDELFSLTIDPHFMEQTFMEQTKRSMKYWKHIPVKYRGINT